MAKAKAKKAKTPRTTLTPKQALFVELYLLYFNATRAAKEAGYSAASAASIGSELLKKPKVKERIHARIYERDSDLRAQVEELEIFLTRVMRGEIKDAFGLDAALADRIKACAELMKRFEAAAGKDSVESITVKFVNTDGAEG